MKTHAVSRPRIAGLAALVAAITTLSACSSSGGSGGTSSAAPNTASGGSTPAGSTSAAADTGAFKVNLDNCDDPAAAQKKITGSWKIGYSLPLSGPVAGVVTYATDGFKARVAAENAKGGIGGVKLDVVYKDDAFTPDRAKANVTQFLQQDKVDSLVTFGSGSTGAMADAQNAACVPLLYPSSSVAQYRDISQYPWTVQFLPSADKEGVYDVKLIQSKFPNGATVGIAENQTASGKGESDAFQKAAKGTNVKIAVIAPSTDPNAAATQLKAKNPDVVYIAGITNDCGPDVQALARIGFKPKLVINPSNCADETGYIAAGAAADKGVVPSYLKNPGDPKLASDPGVTEYLSQVKTADKTNTITVAGWTTADLTINTLKQAAAMPGGLTHENVIKAARNQDYASPMLINGITWNSTATELVGFSGFQTTVWDAATKTFSADGEVISLK
ncbi:MAG TPA: ABC transporter substrate-binding protein [Jatrophihabitans sp.]|uniref:ABC transporter substrate-binding protein n=1 Tax=Jatrophihabitans sp. TaxID=1932789 RepID=UPI002E08B170|nr:ABC transporter substrate-binding protein [Jatrophihabitans sp.]